MSTDAPEGDEKHVSVRVTDPRLVEYLQASDTDADAVRRGLRRMAYEQDVLDMHTPDLTEDQRAAYAWLSEYNGGGRIRIEAAKAKLAQLVQVDKELVKIDLIRPLHNKGYLDVETGIHDVWLTATPPEEVASDE
jgi:hypothetical protein